MGWPTETLIGPSSRWVCLRPPRSGMRCPRPIGVRQRYRISSRRRVPAHFAFPTNCFQLPLSCSLFMFDLCEVNPALLTASTCFNTPLRATKSWSRTPIGSVVGSPVRSSTARRCPEIKYESLWHKTARPIACGSSSDDTPSRRAPNCARSATTAQWALRS